ncbi:MAG TPA: hypothetical protein VLM40_13865 [Gemmata sp.]|nr:hypothetical protein [Gemmata sp.]
MQLFCPACQSAFPGVTRCPKCGGLLLMPHEVSPDAPHRVTEAPPPVSTTFVGRILLGGILALGLYLALRTFVTGLVLAADLEPMGWWLSFKGLMAIHISQAIAVVFGSMIAAAGRPKGYSQGLVVGAMCGGGFLAFELVAGASARDLVLYLQPPVLALFGLIAGGVGSWIWQPAPEIEYPILPASKFSSIQLLEDSVTKAEPPTQWVRVVIGAFVMVLGVMLADEFRKTAQKYSAGMLRVQSLGQAEFITWQLGMFAVAAGGLIAGAGTSAGLRHGILAGAFGGLAVYGMCARSGDPLPPIRWWLSRFSLQDLPLNAPAVIAMIVVAVMVVGVFGGWMGALVFPKLAPENMLRRRTLD